MPKYIFTYHQPTGYVPDGSSDTMAAWQSYLGGIGENLVEMGAPVVGRTAVGEVGAKTEVGGYSVVSAASLDEAATLAKGAPSVQRGGGVSVGELGEM
jgi:hypothetical protein